MPGQSAPLATITSTDHRGLVAIATALGLIFSLISLVIRGYVRYEFSNSFGADDVVICVAFLFSIFQSATVFIEVGKGFGREINDIKPHQLEGLQKVCPFVAWSTSYVTNSSQASYASDILFIFTLYLTKCAVVFLFLRLSPDRRHVMASKIILGLATVLTVASIFMIAISCNVSAPWAFIDEHCTNLWPRWQAFAAFDIFTEVLLGLMPILIVQSLQMSWSKKYIVLMAFSFRLLIFVPIAFRLHYIKEEIFSDNQTFVGTWAVICTQVDISYAIIAATIPCLRPFMAATVTATAPTDGTRKGTRYVKGSREKSVKGNSYGLQSILPHFNKSKNQNTEKQVSTSTTTQEIYGTNHDHNVSVISPGDQHSVESQESRQMIIRRDVEWAVTDEEPGSNPTRTYSQQGRSSMNGDEGVVGHAM